MRDGELPEDAGLREEPVVLVVSDPLQCVAPSVIAMFGIGAEILHPFNIMISILGVGRNKRQQDQAAGRHSELNGYEHFATPSRWKFALLLAIRKPDGKSFRKSFDQ